jgi:hypothetical protein
MKKQTVNLLLTSLLIFNASFILAQPPSGNWTIVTEDNFSSNSFNSNVWGSGSTPWGTENQSACTLIPAEDTWVNDSSLVLRSRAGSFRGPSGKYFKYTSGWAWLKTWHTYGYIEIRAKYPTHRGAWPAFWMLGSGWPPEFDIAEYKGVPIDEMVSAFYDKNNDWHSTGRTGDYSEWHVYGLLWEEGSLTWYVDGVVVHSYKGSSVPDHDMYVILSNGTNCDHSDGTGFPNYMYVDWFRWWQGKSDSNRCDPIAISPNLKINNLPWQEKTSKATIAPGSSVTFSPGPTSGGSWNWNGSGFSGTTRELKIIPDKTSTVTATYTNSCGAQSTQDFTVTVDPDYVCPPTSITPYLLVGNGDWQQTSKATITSGTRIKFGPHPYDEGSWSWSGCGTSGNTRDLEIAPTSNCTITATYTNLCGGKSTQDFIITVNADPNCLPTSITPYLQVNSREWQQTSTVTVLPGESVKLGPHPYETGSWSWSGCGASGTTREKLIFPTSDCTAVATYTNLCGSKSTQDFVVTVQPVTGSDQHRTSETLRLFPNPTNDKLIITMPDSFKDDAEISIYNTFGQVVLNEKDVCAEIKTFDLGCLSKGIYFIRISKGNKVITEKFSKE